jgi:Fe-S oxidoreductase
LIEAFLYEEQTRRGISIRHWDEFSDVADHCTVCHKCESPCPVDIDFGDVSMAMRDLLRRMGKKKFNAGAWASMFFLNALIRKRSKSFAPSCSSGASSCSASVISFSGRLPRCRCVARHRPTWRPAEDDRADRSLYQQEDAGQSAKENGARAARYRRLALRTDHSRSTADTGETEAGVLLSRFAASERLFSQVGLATQAMLWHAGSADGAPPGYLCCGYPQRGAGQFDKAERSLPTIACCFHRVANTLNYLDIKTVVVSCGTCYDQLQGYKFEEIFQAAASSTSTKYLLKRNSHRRRHRECDTCITTRAIRR